MFLFDLLFGRGKGKETAASAEPVAAPAAEGGAAAGLRFDPKLIDRLTDDHRLLVEIYQSVAEAHGTGDLAAVQQRLNQFRVMLQSHLLKENVCLYVYLEKQARTDQSQHEVIRGFRREMDAIGKVVVDFLTKYKEIASRPELAGEFVDDFGTIGSALTARIEREEGTLYPLYA